MTVDHHDKHMTVGHSRALCATIVDRMDRVTITHVVSVLNLKILLDLCMCLCAMF